MSKRAISWVGLAGMTWLTACGGATPASSPELEAHAGSAGATEGATVAARAWGPETPPFNIEVVLRGDPGFGHVKFRQPNDEAKIVELDTWVRDLRPQTHYRLQRAVDTVADGSCTSTQWLTLGKGLESQDIVTDEEGTGRESLWRNLAAVPSGTKFDIHFQVIEAETGAVALESGCYQFVVDL